MSVTVDGSLADQHVPTPPPRDGFRVQVHPGDDKGVGWARLRWPAIAAKAAGIDVVQAGELPIVRALRRSDRREVIAPGEIDADVLVFQRPSNPELVALIPALQARGHAVVIDVDDDVASVDFANRARIGEDPRLVAKACGLADLVTVSTPALLGRYGSHGRAVVVPNCVPAALLDMPRSADGRTVGWGGWIGTHPHDLQVTHGGVGEAVRRAGARFYMVGPPEGVKAALGLDEEPEYSGGVPVKAYHAALGCLDVGIAPLADTAFNRAKSWLKPIEMTARGVAVVMSPLPEYQRLADEGIGVLAASRARNWRARILDLLSAPALRREMAASGREIVREHHTYEGNGWRWAEAWTAAHENHRARHTAAVTA